VLALAVKQQELKNVAINGGLPILMLPEVLRDVPGTTGCAPKNVPNLLHCCIANHKWRIYAFVSSVVLSFLLLACKFH